ncbi:FAD-dependent oxidoreductase [Halodesulfurarchaeum sp. HSR-GB]|uniref:FAD-dependent oxidoreductase n=1 Tax=Halodesulfurarchaeum sp. HSR-GB TaxID=3074077 RepID=UPI00285A7E3E|nr:FAD-dependent oxidoreductase [Halodesulfurarchaeum sp. HSR-GB]MDR5657131.1 FAD-dependent oxidoreductase [Halodesulfurarchaeum sp. HSR-GB]
MTDPFVVIGGDAAGMSAASKARREAPDRDIVVFERDEWVSYGACGLPYYVKGEIDSLDELVSVTPTEFREERNIDLRTNHEATAIDPENQVVIVDGPDGVIEQPYGELLIATGASAIVPPIDGIELAGVYTLHDMAHGKAIKDRLESDDSVDRVGIVGGGYVGIEMAEAFHAHGLDVHLFEMLEHVLAPFGETVGTRVEEHLREQTVSLYLDTTVEGFEGAESVTAVETPDGSVPVDMVLVGAGVTPNTALADSAGIEIGESGAIATDEHGRTSVPNVYAAGDCAEMTHTVTGEPTHVPLALTANRAGRAVGQTVADDPAPVGEIAGTASVKAFDLQAARTGLLDETRAAEAGFDLVSRTITTRSRAGYYPGGFPIDVTLTADRLTGRVLGASMVGEEGVPKRIDTVATALHAGMTVEELESLDLSYAPPFGPTWDPVLTAAKVLSGSIEN